MENSTVVVLMIGAAIWALGSVELLKRWKESRTRLKRKSQDLPADDAIATVATKTALLMRAGLAENRARTDLLLAVTGGLLRVSTHREEIQQALRDVATMLEQKHAGNEQYLAALTEALEMLLEMSGVAEPRDVN